MRCLLLVSLVLALASCGGKQEQPGPPPRAQSTARPYVASVRMTMASLHANGGVPPLWKFTVPPGDAAAGRKVFADFGCGSCHAIKGEPFDLTGIGPDLTGMGSHHPAEYFVESILNPDAVVVDGPGYYGPDGRSIMPSYPDMSVAQLADVVAYLKSLRGPEMPGSGAAAPQPAALAPRPAPPAQAASVFYVQAYDVIPGKLEAFETWFRTEGAAQFLAYPGLVSIETYVDGARQSQALVTIWGFKDEESLDRFDSYPSTGKLGEEFDSFIGPHEHLVFRSPVVYRAATLSAP